MGKIRIAVVGVGNSASSLVQGVHYYKDAKKDDPPIFGLMHNSFGGYLPKDIEFAVGFEVNREKIGSDLGKAIYMKPNNAPRVTDVPELGVEVLPGPILDGVAPHMKESFKVYDTAKIQPVDVAQALRDSGAEILVNYLPVGSREASRAYAQAAIDADCAFINCIPEFIVSDPAWQKKFKDKGLPCAGDDIKSQVGATILHRNLVTLLQQRGIKVNGTYQLNIGGDTDFENMQSEERLESKRVSKTKAVTSLLEYDVPTRIGPSDYVPHLGNNKVCYIRIDGEAFCGVPIFVDAKLSVFDSPNSAGVVIDLIRGTKIALERKLAGPLTSISSYFFKHPPVMIPDEEARDRVQKFIDGKLSE
jgi:myo-inositol-1-phosphate synthase